MSWSTDSDLGKVIGLVDIFIIMPVIAIGSLMSIFMTDLALNRESTTTTPTAIALAATTTVREIAATSMAIVEETITSIVVIVGQVIVLSNIVLSLSNNGLWFWSSVGKHLLQRIGGKIRFRSFSEIDGSN